MAVENYFTNNASNVGEKLEPGSNVADPLVAVGTFEVASGDDNGSTYLLFKDVPSSFRITEFVVMNDAITGATDYDIGLYDAEDGTVVDKDILTDGDDFTSASRANDGLQSVNIADIGAKKTLAELLGLTPSTAKSRYDIVVTANTVGSAAGTITAILKGFAA